MYTVEFQKRGLPHAHVLLWLDGENLLHNGSDIDKIISAKLPNLDLYPKLSKKFENSTTIDDDGYPCYRCRDMMSVQKNGVTLGNMNVIPYSPMLLMKYEITNSKDYTKNYTMVDEIKRYYDCKYLSPCEVVWRIFAYDIHERWLVPRKKCYSIGRLSYIPVGVGELYYMRILLPMQRGCINYDSIKTVNGKIYGNFQDACYALRLLMDDREYIDAIKEANEIGSRNQLRKFFVTLLFTNTMTKPYVIWTATWKLSANGIVYQKRRQLNIPSLHIEDRELKELCLIEIEKLLNPNERSLKDYTSLPSPMMNRYCFEALDCTLWDLMHYDKGEGDIEIPTNLLVLDNDKPLLSLVDVVYSNILENLNVSNFFEDRAILAPTLKTSEEANGLCNGTRLQVKHLGQNVITTTVPTSKNFGDTIFITRMNLVPFDVGFPFKFQRRQFPLSLCFVVGLYLPRPVFTHAQLYVAVSRVKSKDRLKMLILDEERKVCTSTKNVVYKEVFENL
uniref:Uncharacterized protein n=1 Tax=Glycine max TaxID=3847 RepID=K7MGX0_SOYBN